MMVLFTHDDEYQGNVTQIGQSGSGRRPGPRPRAGSDRLAALVTQAGS
jgi:hypothetical protein